MAKKGLILCDTNVLIRLFREDVTVKKDLDLIGVNNLAVSVITQAELLAGANKLNYSKTLAILGIFELVHLDTEASLIFSKLINSKKIFNSGKHIPDLLIAATALANGLPLFTDNKKHFEHIPGIQLYSPEQ
jgi:tRNA(fMet)-specific endonuclease VapC